ncbi:MAG: hypothetical protein MJ252_18825 [archaeon]|nr:hypothetical protein [archaeon]
MSEDNSNQENEEVEEEVEEDDDDIIDNDDEVEEENVVIESQNNTMKKSLKKTLKKEDNEDKSSPNKIKKEPSSTNTADKTSNENKEGIPSQKEDKEKIVNISSIEHNDKPNQIEDSSKNQPFDIDNMSKDEVLAMLLNTPIENINEINKEKSKKEGNNSNEDSFEGEEIDDGEVMIHLKDDDKSKNTNAIANIEIEEKNFDAALTKILSKMVKDQDAYGGNGEIYDLLLNDRELIETELVKANANKKKDISKKVKSYLDKKEKNLQALKEKNKDDFNKIYTFAPTTNQTEKKRNLNQFLKDQEDYQKKLKEKLTTMKDDKDKKETEQIKGRPKINQTSKKLAEEKNKGEGVYQRLYKEPIKEVKVPQKEKKINTNVNTEKFNTLYNEAKIRDKKKLEKENLEKQNLKEISNVKINLSSNKYIFNKFKSLFNTQVQNIILEKQDNPEKLNKFTYDELKDLFFKIKFIKDIDCSTQEENLITEIFNILKDEEEEVKMDHIFIFCLSILNLLGYFLYINASKHSTTDSDEKETNHRNSSGSKANRNKIPKGNSPTDKQQEILLKINNELMNRIVTHKKYGGYDEDKNYIITLKSGQNIFKDFFVLYKNYSNSSISSSNTSNIQNTIPICQTPGKKPNTRSTSGGGQMRTEQKIKRKSLDTNGPMEIKPSTHQKNLSTNTSSNNINMRRIEQLYKENARKKTKYQMEIEKQRKEKEEQELKLCTFKPKINQSTAFNDESNPRGQLSQEERFELLYKKGVEYIQSRKDKTTEELEMEKYKTEYTFKPQIHEVNPEIFENKNSIYQDEDFYKFNKRLKQGRDEKEYRESMLERGEVFINKRIDNDTQSMGSKYLSAQKGSFITNNPNRKTPKDNKAYSAYKTVEPKEKEIFKENKKKLFEMEEEHSLEKEKEEEKHEGERPLLEIDVNLKHGEKQKIIVYEGDTAEALAEKFAEKHNLEDKMKKKLEILIQKELDKVLQRITEENESTFKSTENN